MIRCLIADDEQPAREELRRTLAGIPDLEVAGESRNGIEALEAIDTLKPDLLLLDIEMPGMTGIEVLANHPAPPLTVFVTAYNDYAIKAFEARALDYILKPFRQERVREAVERARAALAANKALEREQIRSLVREARPAAFRLAARAGKRIVLLPLADILHITVEDKLAFVHTASARHMSDRTIAELEAMLEDQTFFRISRQELVNLEHVSELIPWFNGAWKVRLKDGRELDVTRDRARELKALLGI